VFERVVKSEEITVLELTRGSDVTQGAISQHLKSLKLAGLVADAAKAAMFFIAPAEGLARWSIG